MAAHTPADTAAIPEGRAPSAPRSLRVPRATLLSLTLIYLALGEFFVIRLAERSRADAGEQLEGRVTTAIMALDRFAERDRSAASVIAELPDVRAVMAAGSGDYARLNGLLVPIMDAARFDGFALVDRRGQPIVRPGVDPVAAAILADRPDFIARVMSARTTFSEIVPARVAAGLPAARGMRVPPEGEPVMFVAAAVRDAGDRPIGAIVLRLQPSLRLDPILRSHRVGNTGDAYAVGRAGVAVTSTRFDEALAAAGRIPPGRSAALTLALRSPRDGSLVKSASGALEQTNGSDVDGYVNAGGVTVVGAWGWSASLNVGVVIEQARDEVMSQYFILRDVYWALGLGIMFANTAAWRGLRTARRLRDQRKAAEHDLHERDLMLNAIIDSSPNAVIVLDQAGIVVRNNAAAERLFGLGAQAVVGTSIGRFVAAARPFEPGQVERFLDEAAREAEAVRADGTHYAVEVRWAPFEVGAARHYTVILIDITQRKETERALIRAKEQAEAAARAKSEFLAMMSHEIRTPMNGVLGMTSLLADTSLNAEQRQFVEATRRSADLLMSVINDILDFSKVEAGKMTIEPIPFDLQAAVGEVAELLAPRAIEKRVELVVRLRPETPCRVVGDSGRIRQVLLNLTGNALKFTESGHVVVNVDGHIENGHAVLRFEVEDTGIGIEAGKLAQLFQPFTQADASTTRRFGGTGLGLSISKRLVELMGGTIGVNSEVGRGSTFWFTLRLPIDTTPMLAEASPVSLSGVRVLVVDDVDVNVRLLAEWLRSWGMRVDTAADGERGLAALRAAHAQGDPVRVAILDYLMPRMDGEMLGRAIRGDPALADTRMIIATSAAQRGDAERFQQAGFDAYLTKPFRPSVVSAACVAVLARPVATPATPIITRHSLVERTIRVAAAGEPAGSRATDGARPLRALLAEDNPVNQMVAVRMLERLGCRADVANDGAEAVQMASAFDYDLVFMDVQMPNVDGLEATRQLRATPRGRHQYIVAMTANAMQGDRERCIEAGMDDYVPKPVTPDFLKQALDRRRARPPVPSA